MRVTARRPSHRVRPSPRARVQSGLDRSTGARPHGSRHVSNESASLRSAAEQALASQAEVSRSRRGSSESLVAKASAKAESTRAELRAEVQPEP